MLTRIIIKYAVSAAIIAAVSEISKRTTLLVALLASLPLTSLLAFIWLYSDTHDNGRVAALSNNIFWLVLPSLVLFIVLPPLLRRFSFYPALGLAVAAMLLANGAMVGVLSRFGIKL